MAIMRKNIKNIIRIKIFFWGGKSVEDTVIFYFISVSPLQLFR